MLAVMAQSANSGEGGNVRLATSGLPQKPGGVNVDMEACSTEAPTSADTIVTVNVKINDGDCEELGKIIRGMSPYVDTAGCSDITSCSDDD